ncbi:thymidylate kinase [Nocardioides zeae]|uniref:Thymidylate kinase n=1 Tax=Nocardioides zeae TaxID=1457234 RepID=A0ACC6ICT6_9ACTN|nr:hypothetical protein [Nocardioides zeae]MDR6175548.1 thymidylate kinase [Nocardioides zeae]MDR6208479.1 thymidylate kinase [Nocardioides zeae]
MLIEVCGIDGAGTSTLIARIMRMAHEAAVPCYERQLRGVGKRLLTALAVEQGHSAWWAVFERGPVEFATALEMYQLYYSSIAPILFPGQIVFTDTFVRSWVATAIANGAVDPAPLMQIYGRLPAPDMSVELVCPAEVAYERILARPKGDHILRSGGKARLHALADAYAGLASNELVDYGVTRVDSRQGADVLETEVIGAVLRWAAEHDPLLHRRLAHRA